MQRIQQRKHRVKPHLSWIFPAAQQNFLARLKFGSAMQRCSDAHQYFHYYWQACWSAAMPVLFLLHVRTILI